MIFIIFWIFFKFYFVRIIITANTPKTKLKLNFQNEAAFFSSINSKATKRNFAKEIPIIKRTKPLEKKLDFEISTVVKVSTIKNP